MFGKNFWRAFSPLFLLGCYSDVVAADLDSKLSQKFECQKFKNVPPIFQNDTTNAPSHNGISPQIDPNSDGFELSRDGSQINAEVEDVIKSILNIVGGEIDAIFPQKQEDLIKIDDVKRNQFLPLAKWLLKVIKSEIAGPLKTKLLELDHKFIELVKDWQLYESCTAILDNTLGSYEIPDQALGYLDINSILLTNPDVISISMYEKFKNLISIINTAAQYANPEATTYLAQLKTQISEKIAIKFAPEAIRSQLADHSQSEIEKSIAHYALWLKLLEF